MEKQNKTTTTNKNKKNNPMKIIGKTIKDTFIEMSSSLAGWIDDTGMQFSGKKKKNNSTNSNNKTCVTSSKSNSNSYTKSSSSQTNTKQD